MYVDDDSSQQFEQFDALAYDVQRVAHLAEEAHPDHEDDYETALLNAYGNAMDFLQANPSCADMYRQMGVEALKNTLDRQSLAGLRFLSNQGYLSGERSGERFYTFSEHQTFDDLFWKPGFAQATPAQGEKPDDDTDETHSEEGINTEDVVEFLRSKEFTDSELTFVGRSMDTTPVTLAEIRKTEWSLLSLNADEFSEFEQSLPELRARARTLLLEVDVACKWSETKVRGKPAFHLVVTRASEDRPEAVDPQAGLKELFGSHVVLDLIDRPSSPKAAAAPPAAPPTPDSKPPTTDTVLSDHELLEFAGVGLEIIRKTILTIGDGRLNTVINEITDILSTDRLTARAIITAYCASGDIYFKHDHGTRFVRMSSDSAEASERKSGAPKPPKAGGEKHVILDNQDFIAAKTLFSQLVQVHIERGETMAELCRAAGDEIGQERVRLLIRQFERDGLLKVSAARNYGRGRKGAMVTFATREAYTSWRETPDLAIQELEAIQNNRTTSAKNA